MKKSEKEHAVKEWVDKLNKASGVYLTDFRGLNVETMTSLRRICRGEEVEYRVVKNSLLRHAMQEIGNDELLPYLEGPTGVALAYDDPLKPARIFKKFGKDEKPLKMKAAYGEGQLFLPDQIDKLAAIPSMDGLAAQLVGILKGPLYNLNGALHSLLWRLVSTLDQVAKAKEAVKEE
jgi:large subunit ribosomal protein L10